MSSTDAVFSPQGVKKNYRSQLSTRHKTTLFTSAHRNTGVVSPVWSKKPTTLTEAPKISMKPAREGTMQSVSLKSPYPKILQDGVVENFKAQEIQEKATCAEPVSPPNEKEVCPETSVDKESEKKRIMESAVSSQVESVPSTKLPFTDEVNQHQFTAPSLTPYHVTMEEESYGFLDESDRDVPLEIPAEKEDIHKPQTPVDILAEKESKGKEHVQEESSDSETEAVIEPNFESKTSSPVSEYEPEESMLNKKDSSLDECVVKENVDEVMQECSIVETYEIDVEDKLYTDGEEMDTWDSVMERKVDLNTYDGTKTVEEKRQHAEPEEDLSSKEQKHEKTEICPDFSTDVMQVDPSLMDMQAEDEGHVTDLHGNEEDNEDEDSQNVSVSWRAELESESYAQDNTVADTRPLIQYKSDETDANTSHAIESESSEGEEEKKVGETGSWNEGEAKRFGTMEDLCEEVEEAALDGDYDLGYIHSEDRSVGLEGEHVALANDKETADDTIQNVSGEQLEKETKELPNPPVAAHEDYTEGIETGRLVEQELENLDTHWYSAHFAQQQASEREKTLYLQSAEETEEEEDTFPCVDPEVVNQESTSFTELTNQPYGNVDFSDSSVTGPEVKPKDQEAPEEREEEDKHSVSMVTQTDVSEIHLELKDFVSNPRTEEINIPEEANAVLPPTADEASLEDVINPTEAKEAVPAKASSVSQEHYIGDVTDCQDVPQTAEWDDLENLSEEIRAENLEHEEGDQVPESAETPLHEEGGITTHNQQPLNMFTDTVPDDILVMKDSSEVLKPNGNDNNLQDFFHGVKNDYWVSSLETGATNHPDNSCNEATENQNLGFANNLVWEDLENTDVVNWNSRVDIDSSKALADKKEQEQMHLEVKQVLGRNIAEGELVHSEESEVEAEAWSSGEEPV